MQVNFKLFPEINKNMDPERFSLPNEFCRELHHRQAVSLDHLSEAV